MIDNPFVRCLEAAQDLTASRRPQTWYKNPFRWLDEEDLLYGYRHAREKARAFLASLLVSRPTEFQALMHLAYRAFNGYDLERLTERQALAVLYAREAKEAGITPSIHIAERLGIARQNAWALLKRADKRKIMTFGGAYPLNSRDTRIIALPDNRTIKAIAKSLKRLCATCNNDTPDGTKALCWDCHKRFNLEGQYFPYTPDAADQLIRYSNQQHWQAAKAAAEQRISYEALAEVA